MSVPQINLTYEQLEALRPWLISVWQTGSTTLPWIESYGDRDIVFYVEHNCPSEEVSQFRQFTRSLRPPNECWILEIVPDRKYLFAYQYHFLQHIYGEDKPEWDIFEPEMMRRTQSFLKHWVTRGVPLDSKLWYHVLTMVYMYKNGNYTLTAEQAANVRLCHDRKTTVDLYNFICDEVNHWQIDKHRAGE
jgi:hypothetical protein